MRQNHRPLRRAITGAVGALAVLLTVFAGAPAPATAAATTTWRADGYGPGNTGYNPAETAINADTVTGLRQRWSVVSPVIRNACSRQSPPVVANNRLYLTDQGGIGAYDATTGAALWTYRFNTPSDEVTPRLTVVGSRLYAGLVSCVSQSDPDGIVLAFDAATGAVVWSGFQDAPPSVLVVDKDIVVASGEDIYGPTVTAYRASDGTQLWTYQGHLPRPVSANGRLLVNRYDEETGSRVGSDLLDIRTGTALWSSDTVWSVLAAGPSGGPLYAAGPAGQLARINVETGAVAWSVPDAAAQLAVDGSRLYVAQGTSLVARDAGTGVQQWSRSFPAQLGKPVVAGGVVYATVSGRNVSPLAVATGDTLDWEAPYEGAIGHPVVVNGRLYVTTGRVLDAYTL
jgi:outer membrane protein assembly factor BamB